jgi:DNA-binding XRE family transcriptional regulator
MTIGKKIKKLRKKNKYTQEKLAKKIGVSINSISFWELDKFEPTILNCISLADVFGVTLDELCCRGDV